MEEEATESFPCQSSSYFLQPLFLPQFGGETESTRSQTLQWAGFILRAGPHLHTLVFDLTGPSQTGMLCFSFSKSLWLVGCLEAVCGSLTILSLPR